MVSVRAATTGIAANKHTLWTFLQSKVFTRIVQRMLKRAAAAGSLWTLLALALGGFYEKPWQLPGVAARVLYTVIVTLAEYAVRGFKPLFSEWTLSFELVRAVTRCLMSNYGDRMLTAPCAQHVRRQSDVLGSAIGFFATRRLGVTTESFEFNGLEHIWIRSNGSPTSADSSKPRRRIVVIYYHGGGYAVLSPRMYIHFGSELQHRIRDRLRDKLNPEENVEVELLLANYRKIPEYPHPIPPLDALAMYKYVLENHKVSPSEIVVAGDSAGAGLAVATMLRLRDETPELLPAAGILSCPFVDLDIGGDERKQPYCIIGDKAGIAIYKYYHPRQGDPSTWGDASPIHCDLRGLPPVYIQAAELDYILSHSTRLIEKAREDGNDHWELEIFHNVPHVFSFFPAELIPSAARGLDAMAEYAATKLAGSLQAASSAPRT